MQNFHALPPELEKALARGAVAITANQRSARSLRFDFDRSQHLAGVGFWRPPEVFAWSSWLPVLWQKILLEGYAPEILLNGSQEHALWRAIVARDSETQRPVDALAEAASRAWHLLWSYRGQRRLQQHPGNSDHRVFARWAAEFENRCIRGKYITEAQVSERLREAVERGALTLPQEILLIAFDDFNPSQTALLEAIRNSGTTITEHRMSLQPSQMHLIDCASEQEEIAACARWMDARLAADPTSRLAVIVPSIESCRLAIDRTFREVLAPEQNEIAAPVGGEPFEFSLGVPLASTPAAEAAFDLLRWITGPLPVDRISALMLSPYFAMEESRGSEFRARAELDAFVIRQKMLLQPRLSLDELLRAATGKTEEAVPQLRRRLVSMREMTRKGGFERQQRTHAEWAAAIQTYLDAAGWCVPAQLESIEFQARSKWEDALDELATLDFDDSRVSFADAVKSLQRIATNMLFAPETRHTPVQILGPLEAAGATFDAIWFLRASDLEWPVSSSANPLLPWGLQRDLGMPGANPARELELGRRITERICSSAPDVVFSYARESTDGHQRPSTILSGLALERLSAGDFAPTPRPLEPVALELVMAEPRIPAPPAVPVHGGASILALQAACGFRAFAEKRLFASALDSTTLGLDAGERGSLVHEVLDRFWERTVSQEALRRMPEDERRTMLLQAIDDSIRREIREIEPGWSLEYIAVERQRLLQLLLPWLEYEAARPTSFTVRDREKKLTNIRIEPLTLEIRVDRVDELQQREGEQPRTVILDYKTGKASPSEWLGERPDAPQLPLYAVAADDPHLAAVAFANIQPGKEMKLNGFEQEKGILPKHNKLKAESLEAQVAEWKRVLSALARDFHSGRAEVNPKKYPRTCEFCQQRLLCRLDAAALNATTLESSDEDADGAEEEVG